MMKLLFLALVLRYKFQAFMLTFLCVVIYFLKWMAFIHIDGIYMLYVVIYFL